MPKRISNKIDISFDYAGFFDRTIAELSGTYEYHSIRNKAATFIKQRGEETFYLVYLTETQQSKLSGWYIQDSESLNSKEAEYYLRLLTEG